MKVKLVRDWFGPDATLYRKGVHSFRQDWKEKLPKGAVVLADEVKPEEPAKPAVKK